MHPIQVAGYQCSCPSGFNGTSCEINLDDCLGVDCKNGGTCVDGIGNSSCVCVAGFQGEFCADNINECQVSGRLIYWVYNKLPRASNARMEDPVRMRSTATLACASLGMVAESARETSTTAKMVNVRTEPPASTLRMTTSASVLQDIRARTARKTSMNV